ncbi:MAG TPA: solute carrier family 23 protein, partial [Spirochaetota bacterium]|nr:solute carrier family 23 protein [Spirochaetota bacterium]
RNGVMLTGLTNAASGILGVIGPVNYSLSLGVIASTGCASRFTLPPTAAMLLVLSFSPALIAFIGDVPSVVIGAVLLYIVCTQIAAGLVVAFEERREIRMEDLASYYRAAPPLVSDESYSFSADVLKKFGKDDEARKNRKIDALKEELGFFEEIYLYLKFESFGQNLLMKCFDDQWRLVDKRRGDSAEVFKNDFFSFIDGLINYFNNSLLYFLNGTVINLDDGSGDPFEGRIFAESFFEREIRALEAIVQEFYYLRTNNPNLVVSHDELQRIFKGQLKSMSNIGAILKKTGGVFYQLGRGVHRVLREHRKWVLLGKPVSGAAAPPVPLDGSARESLNENSGRPVPFGGCRLVSAGSKAVLARTLAGLPVINDDFNDGILIIVVAFCYQLAHECGDENIQGDLENRKSILSTLRELANN